MSDLFETFFDEFSLFGKPYVIYNTNGIRDLMPTFWREKDYGYRCTAKTLGVDEKDVCVELTDYGIKLFGKSELEGQWYDTTLKLPIAKTVMNDIKEIKTFTKNGITFVDLYLDKPEKKKILINGK
jgi:HSP20 family molecular chaperone IbpA